MLKTKGILLMKPTIIILILFKIICYKIVVSEESDSKTFSNTHIKGTVENPTTDSLIIQYPKYIVGTEFISKTIRLNKKNQFHQSFFISQPSIISINYNAIFTKLYIQPGDVLTINFNGDNYPNEIFFDGQRANENRLLFKMNSLFRTNQIDYHNQILDEFTLEIDKFKNAKLEFLMENINTYNLSSQFINYLSSEILFEWAYHKMSYELVQRLNKRVNVETLDSTYFNFIDNLELSNENVLSSYYYQKFIEYYFDKIIQSNNRKKTRKDLLELSKDESGNLWAFPQRYMIAKEILSGRVQQMVMATAIIDGYQNGQLEKARFLYSDFIKHLNWNDRFEDKKFLENHKIIELLSAISVEGDNAFRIMRGASASSFKFFNQFEQQVSLEQFVGKVVFLEFWASWCGPCIHIIPIIKKIEEQFVEADVVFIKISLDTNRKEWRKTMQKFSIGGINLNANGFNSSVAKAYNISGVPTCFIIDKKGNIVELIKGPPVIEKVVRKIKSLL